MLHLPDFELRGREVTLRPLRLEDASALAAASGESREPAEWPAVRERLAGLGAGASPIV